MCASLFPSFAVGIVAKEECSQVQGVGQGHESRVLRSSTRLAPFCGAVLIALPLRAAMGHRFW